MRILYDPAPRRTAEIFAAADRDRFFAGHEVMEYDGGDRDRFYAAALPEAEVAITQQPLDRARLDAAPHLRAIFNVETNFLPNIDYETCFARGIHVLAPSGVFALPVAEIGLGMALSLARGIHAGHAAFAEGREAWGLAGNAGAELLTGSDIGLIGFGDLARALVPLLAGFRPRLRVFDPWLPDGHIARAGLEPAPLDTVLAESRLVFVLAAITDENRRLLDAARLARMQPGAMLVLLSRAAIADFDALRTAAASGRLRIATDVFPQEPLPPDDPLRTTPNLLLSAHRAGALETALAEIGTRVLEDLALLGAGLPPVACRRAERETVARMRSMPVAAS